MKRYSRRDWLKTAGGLALANALNETGAATRPETGCLRGFGSYGLPGYTLEQAIDLVAKTGFDSIEFAAMTGYPGAPDQVSRARRKELRNALKDSGLGLGALMGLPDPDAARQAENTAWVKQLLELATDLAPEHPPIIQSVLGGGEWEAKKTLFRDCLGPWVQLAADSGIVLAIKPHRGHAMSLPEQAVWLIEQLDATGRLGLVYDFSHYAYRDLGIEETITTALPYTSYLVMKDALQIDGKVRFALPGETGTMPHARILKSFYERGYRGEVCCEISSQIWKAPGYDAPAATATCFSNLTKIFSDAGLG